jgi:hypothetical protein
MYYLESEISEKRIVEFPEFNRIAIKKAIIYYLENNPTDTVYYYKVSNDDEYVGDDILGFYAVNPKNGKPSKLIFNGEKTYYKSLDSKSDEKRYYITEQSNNQFSIFTNTGAESMSDEQLVKHNISQAEAEKYVTDILGGTFTYDV